MLLSILVFGVSGVGGALVGGALTSLWVALHAGAALAAVAASWHTRGLARLVWALFAAAQAGRALLQWAPEAGISSLAEGTHSTGIAVAFLVLSAPTGIAVLIIYRRLRPERGWQGVLDGAIAVLCLAAAAWALLTSADRPMDRDLLYLIVGLPPFLDLLCAVALTWVIARHGMRSAPGWLRAIVVGLLIQAAAGMVVLSGAPWTPEAARAGFAAAAIVLGAAALRRRETTGRAWAEGLHDAPPAWSERLPYILGSAVVLMSVARPDFEMRLAAAMAAFLVAIRAISAVAVRQGLIGERDRLLIADPLTGAYNRRHLAEYAPRVLAHAQRSGEPLSVVAFDLDRFKHVNDVLGHDAGDRLLMEVARVVTAALRASDVLVRLGGDEFLVVCPGTPGEGAATLAERLRSVICQAAGTSAPGTGVSASLGISTYPTDASELDELLRRADEALYAAKAAGRNAVHRWEEVAAAGWRQPVQ